MKLICLLAVLCVLVMVPWMVFGQEGKQVPLSASQPGNWFTKGGIFMYPIALCSLLGLSITLERLFALQRRKIIPAQFLQELRQAWGRGDLQTIQALCREYETPLTRILEAGFRRIDLGITEAERAIEATGQHEVALLTTNLRMLGAIASLSPLLGLLGTVTGMIKAFDVIAQSGTGNPGVVASGIAEALITTAAGLIVGIPALATYHFLRGRVDRLVYEMEEIALELLANLLSPKPFSEEEETPDEVS